MCGSRADTPCPIANFWHIFAVGMDVRLVIQQLVTKKLLGVCGARAQTRHTIDHVTGQVESIEIVQHHHVEWGRGRSLFLVSTHVHTMMISPAIGESMDEQGIPMKGEDNRLVGGKERIK